MESMIKVCSLDFLNDDEFTVDIKSGDGTLLYSKGSKITPAILLKLYFREIFVEEGSLKEEIITGKSEIKQADSVENIKVQPVNVNVEEILEPQSQEVVIKSSSLPENGANPHIVETPEEEINQDSTVENALEDLMTNANEEVAPKVYQDKAVNGSEETGKGPREATEADFVNLKEDTEKPVAPQLDLALPEETVEKGPVAPKLDLSKPEVEEETVVQQKPKEEKIEEVVVEEVKAPEFLKFDEEQAQRIVKHSLILGKSLGYSESELKELHDVAYYCNIGITNFKPEQAEQKGFEEQKAMMSAKVAEEKGLSMQVIDAIKFHINKYESASFSFKSKIPYYHIVAIVYYYERMLTKGTSKGEALDKMLQVGGNKFNVFALHKFIRIMREEND